MNYDYEYIEYPICPYCNENYGEFEDEELTTEGETHILKCDFCGKNFQTITFIHTIANISYNNFKMEQPEPNNDTIIQDHPNQTFFNFFNPAIV
jgi:uncharacterized Zn finger protein